MSKIQKSLQQKPPNPGRQEWVRKLGKMSKQLKLRTENKDIYYQNRLIIKQIFGKWKGNIYLPFQLL